MNRQEIFNNIYRTGQWGRAEGRGTSGPGSHDPMLVQPYISRILELISSEGLEKMRFIDIGCGDFNIGKMIAPHVSHYHGVDIAPDIISHNNLHFACNKIEFSHLDAVIDELPDGEVCFLRQVLQHFSNEEIEQLIKKLDKYKLVIITEHQPSDDALACKNYDIETGAGIRLEHNSGVYLDHYPFNIDSKSIERILSIPVNPKDASQGCLNTFVYRPMTAKKYKAIEECSIPKIIHFVYGLDQEYGGKPFSFAHWAAIKSAIRLNPEYRFIYWHTYIPQSHYFDDIRPYLELRRITPPEHIYGNQLCHVAHKADVVRLLALNEIGGIYLDIDTITVKSFDNILCYDFVMGVEQKEGQAVGLCNAIMAAKPKSAFGARWLNSYRTFRSRGRDEFWNEHSVLIPSRLASDFPTEITILSSESFFKPDWSPQGLADMFIHEKEFPKAIAHHLWESFSWGALRSFNEYNSIVAKNSYGRIIRKILGDDVLSLQESKRSWMQDQFKNCAARLNLGCGANRVDGYVNCDMYLESGADLVFDLTKDEWPIPSASVAMVRLHHVLEHLGGDLQTFFKELYRVVVNGAVIDIAVPHPRHDWFLIDPTHVRPWLPESFFYLDKKQCSEWFFSGDSKTPLALYWGIDFEVISVELQADHASISNMQNMIGSAYKPSQLLANFNNISCEISVKLKARKEALQDLGHKKLPDVTH